MKKLKYMYGTEVINKSISIGESAGRACVGIDTIWIIVGFGD